MKTNKNNVNNMRNNNSVNNSFAVLNGENEIVKFNNENANKVFEMKADRNVSSNNTDFKVSYTPKEADIASTETDSFELSVPLPWGGCATIKARSESTSITNVEVMDKARQWDKESTEQAIEIIKSGVNWILTEGINKALTAANAIIQAKPEPEYREEVYEGLDPFWRLRYEELVSYRWKSFDERDDRGEDLSDEVYYSEYCSFCTWRKVQEHLYKCGILSPMQTKLWESANPQEKSFEDVK